MMCPSSGEVSLTVRGPLSEGAVRLCSSPKAQCIGWGGKCGFTCPMMTEKLSFVLSF